MATDETDGFKRFTRSLKTFDLDVLVCSRLCCGIPACQFCNVQLVISLILNCYFVKEFFAGKNVNEVNHRIHALLMCGLPYLPKLVI